MGIKLLRGKRKPKRQLTREQSIAIVVWEKGVVKSLPEFAVAIFSRVDAGENLREHWAVKKKRKDQHRLWGMMAINSMRLKYNALPCTITFIRYGPRLLDEGDNLPNCFKHIRDQIAKSLGTHDGPSAPIKWKYLQAKAPQRCFGFTVQWQPLTEESK